MISFLQKLFGKVKQEPLEINIKVRVVFENSPNLITTKEEKKEEIAPIDKPIKINSFDYDLGEPEIVKNLGKEVK